METTNNKIEYSGINNLFAGEIEATKSFAEKTMDKISRISSFNRLKVSMKPHGNTVNTTKRKFSMNLLLSRGNRVIHVSKEITEPVDDDNSKTKTKYKWSVKDTIHDAFTTLEDKIVSRKEKKEH